jgi:hypothetical protein
MKTNLDLPDNVTLKFDANGVFVRVVLNVPKELVPYISPNNRSQGTTFNTYQIHQHIPSIHISYKTIMEVYQVLLTRAMSNVRAYKAKYYEAESKRLNFVPLQLSFDL